MISMRYVFLLMIASAANAADWKSELLFRAGFDGSLDAATAKGDGKLYTAPTYKRLAEAQPGLTGAPVEHLKSDGRMGGALRFTKKNTAAVFYKAENNARFDAGTISFWLKLNPDQDLEPGYCDPIQLTAKDYNDAAIWVDFTRDDKPRHFRLGVFGDLKSWNPTDIPPDKNPNFTNRLVVVKQAPFSRDRWTHVAISYENLGTPKGRATLYLNGASQGNTPVIGEPFSWSASNATIRLGVNYVGLFDDLALFRRPLTANEIAEIAKGIW